jgi:hypothetical protein
MNDENTKKAVSVFIDKKLQDASHYDKKTEKAILGALINIPDGIVKVHDHLKPEMFYVSDHQLIYRAIQKMYTESKPIDYNTLSFFMGSNRIVLDAGNIPYLLSTLTNAPIKEAHITYYAEIITDLWKRRQVIELTNGEITDIIGPVNGFIKKIIDKFSALLPDEKTVNSSIFIPDWHNKPPHALPVIKLAGINILTYQNISTITAAHGSGKSSCIEAIGASFLNPMADCLGFETDRSINGILIVDTERTQHDVWNSFYRMCRRAGVSEETPIPGVRIIGMRGIANPEDRKNEIEKQLKTDLFKLLLIDGVGDLLYDTNNVEQAKNTQGWLRWLTDFYNVSILVTIHPNPGSEKARGHSGGELLRDSETVLLIKDFEGAKILTSDFEHGKNRNTGKITAGFKWSDEKMMFVSTDYEQLAENKKADKIEGKRNELEQLAKKILSPVSAILYKDLVSAIMQKTALEIRQSKNKVQNMVGWGIISEKGGYYRLIQ